MTPSSSRLVADVNYWKDTPSKSKEASDQPREFKSVPTLATPPITPAKDFLLPTVYDLVATFGQPTTPIKTTQRKTFYDLTSESAGASPEDVARPHTPYSQVQKFITLPSAPKKRRLTFRSSTSPIAQSLPRKRQKTEGQTQHLAIETVNEFPDIIYNKTQDCRGETNRPIALVPEDPLFATLMRLQEERKLVDAIKEARMKSFAPEGRYVFDIQKILTIAGAKVPDTAMTDSVDVPCTPPAHNLSSSRFTNSDHNISSSPSAPQLSANIVPYIFPASSPTTSSAVRASSVPLISAEEMARLSEAVLQQVDWDEVREYCASNRRKALLRKVVKRALQDKVDEIWKSEVAMAEAEDPAGQDENEEVLEEDVCE